MNLEKDFEIASVHLGEWYKAVRGQEHSFDEVTYTQIMRQIKQKLRKEMQVLGISHTRTQCVLSDEIRQMALELDKMVTLHGASGQCGNQFNASLELYDLLVGYAPKQEKNITEESTNQEDDAADMIKKLRGKRQVQKQELEDDD